MPWQTLLCNWHLTKQWAFTRKHFLCVHATEVHSSHLLSPFSSPVTQPSSQLPWIPLFLMEFILCASKYIKSITHCSSQVRFACTCNQLNASVLKSSNYCNLKQSKRVSFPCPSVGDGVPQPEWHKIPTFSIFPHDMPSRRGQVKTTWIATDECFVLILITCFVLSLLSVWRQSSVLCHWLGCAGCNRERRSPRKRHTCRKLSPGVAGWAKGETSLSGRYQVGALQQCQIRK